MWSVPVPIHPQPGEALKVMLLHPRDAAFLGLKMVTAREGNTVQGPAPALRKYSPALL